MPMQKGRKMSKGFMWEHIINLQEWVAYYNGTELGKVFYYDTWKKWVWEQNEDIIMSIKCLEKVCKKIEGLMTPPSKRDGVKK